MKNQAHPIIVVKRRKAKSHGAAHGSWKIAYADFMTAMMAFFLVMWLISISSPKELIQIAEYFRTPLATAVTGGDRISNSESPIPGGGDDYTQSQGEVNKQPNIEELKKRMEQSRLRKLRGDLDQLIESDPKLRALRPHLKIDLVQEGLRIQIIDSQNRPMFRTGSADVEPYMRDILRAIAPVLNGIPNRISLSGHTDDFPYASGEKGYSNWELSADRANASRRELMVGGLNGGKVLRVVGMDVVKRNIQEMGGHVEIQSMQGTGTTIRILLPLTLAILDGMSVRVADEVFILPLNAVMESLQPREADLHPLAGGERVLEVRGEYLPIVELWKVFNVAGAKTEATQGIVVILQSGGRRYALLVDQLIGQHQVVVKNLESNYRKVPGISAATILGDGSVALIVDVSALQAINREQRMANTAA